jgi:transposase
MADKMRVSNYQAMIEALYNFGSRTSQISQNIMQAANNCRSLLGEEDSSITGIYTLATRSQKAYNEVALKALRIARDMAEELDKGELELMLWETD